MDKNKYEEWFNALPEDERDMPYFKDINGKLVSPRQRLITESYRIRTGNLSSRQLSNDVLSEADETEIVKKRTEILVKNARRKNVPIISFGIASNDSPPVPVSEINKEIDNHTELGEAWKKVQLKVMERQLRKLEV